VKEILVVDSNMAVRKLLEFALTREGFEVSAFSDGLSGLDAAFKTPPCLFVVDYRMEGMTLNQFLEKVRQREVFKRIPVILMVNTGDQYDETKMRALGMVDTIKKPLDPIEVLEKVKVHASADETDTIVTAIEPPPPPPSVEQAEPDDEMVRIEELLGWSSPSEESPFSEISETQVENQKKGEVETIKATGPSFNLEEAKKEAENKEELILFEEEELKVSDSDQKDSRLNEASFAAVSSASAIGGLSAEVSTPLEEDLNPPPSQKVAEEKDRSVQIAPQAEPVQGVSPSNLTQLEGVTRQVVEEFVHKIAPDIVEKVAWEVIPSLAEITVQKSVGTIQIKPPQTAEPSQESTPPISSQVDTFTRQVVEEIVHKIAPDIVEKVAWEVVPSLAEISLKKQINHLKDS
jgi:DNA-binding response OmpR family regulator